MARSPAHRPEGRSGAAKDPVVYRVRRGASGRLRESGDPFARVVSERVYEALRGRGSLRELGTPAEVADRMLATLPEPSPWDQACGPFYRTPQIRKLLGGVSRQAVDDRVRRRTLLALRTADGERVYPTFQFDDRFDVLRGLPDVLRALDGLDDWTLAAWLVAPRERLEGQNAVAWLRAGRALAAVLDLARDAAARFAR